LAIDDTADNYDQAFVLFALAKAYSVTGDAHLAQRALALLEALRKRAHPLGGFQETDPPSLPLRSNPHMHLLEAAVAWVEAAELEEFRQLAGEISALCQRFFIDRGSGALLEYFDLDWQPICDGAGHMAEPGHQFEWAWLLLRWRALGGCVDPQVATTLYDFAVRHGIDMRRNVAINEVYVDGSARDASARLWPQTERLKASLAMVEIGKGQVSDVMLAWRGLRQYGLTANPALFRDKLREDGGFEEEASFASSLYHITCAISELDRVLSGPAIERLR
jgi:mannose-6-phosphate isomerase